MYTDPNHLRVSDPGNVEGNPVFIYLDAFATQEHVDEYLKDYDSLDALKAHYTRGGLGDVKVKRFLERVLQETLEPIRQRRAILEKKPDYVKEVLHQGTEKACEKASKTLQRVKESMQMNYFRNG
jgi:tryptophanyl-tRNA synthetase